MSKEFDLIKYRKDILDTKSKVSVVRNGITPPLGWGVHYCFLPPPTSAQDSTGRNQSRPIGHSQYPPQESDA